MNSGVSGTTTQAVATVETVQTTAATCLPGSCSGRCGGGSDVDCWCDEMCQYSGDCCCDREAVCSTTTEAPSTTLLLGACGTRGSCNETSTSEPTGEVLDTVVNKLEVETLPSTNAEVLTMQYSELEITTPVVPGKIPTLEAF